MATGKQSLYNWNNGNYSDTGYPFEAYQLSLQASFSTSVYDTQNLQSMVYVSVTLANIGIDWGYRSGREVKLYWNGTQVASFNPPNLLTQNNVSHTTALGAASFPVQHTSDGQCVGELKVEWTTEVLAYTVNGVTKNVTELGCKGTVIAEPISGGTSISDVFLINGKDFIPIIKEGGIEITRADANTKSVTTMSGTEWKKALNRHDIKLSFMDMSSQQYQEYAASLATNPAAVVYRDDEDGQIKMGTFYITNIRSVKRQALPGVTFLVNLSLELREKTAS